MSDHDWSRSELIYYKGKWGINEHFYAERYWDFTTVDGPKGQYIGFSHLHLTREEILKLAKGVVTLLNNL